MSIEYQLFDAKRHEAAGDEFWWFAIDDKGAVIDADQDIGILTKRIDAEHPDLEITFASDWIQGGTIETQMDFIESSWGKVLRELANR